MTIAGIDVSNYQGAIDWPTVAGSGVAFAVIHCTDGLAVDPWFAQNWQGAGAAGLVRGAYALVYPDLHTPEASAALFVQTVAALLAPGDFVALDLEEGNGDLSGWATAWLAAVAQGLGFKPLLYSGLYFLQDHGCAGNATIAQYGLWLASWGVPTPALPAGWDVWAIWQYSAQGSVSGVRGSVDLDVFNGTVEQLRAYGLPAPVVRIPTNDDFEQMHRLVDAQPFDAATLVAYAQQFSPQPAAAQRQEDAMTSGPRTVTANSSFVGDTLHAIEGVPLTELKTAEATLVAAFAATPDTLPLRQRLTSRKFLTAAFVNLGTVGATILGGLPRSEAGVIVGVVSGLYLVSQAIVDAAAALNAPPPGTMNVPLAHQGQQA